MAVKTIFIPVTATRPGMGRGSADMREYQQALVAAKEAAERELEGLLNAGYDVVCSHVLSVAEGNFIAVVMYHRGETA